MIRNAQVCINGYLYSQLRLAAKLDGLDCTESLIELWLGERLAQRPEITDLAARLAKAKKDVTAVWEAEQADKRQIGGKP